MKKKAGKRRIAAFWVDCPHCGGAVENHLDGSQMFQVMDTLPLTGKCGDCGAQVKIPALPQRKS
jgi:rRNA maturation protein Nop10